MPETGGVSAHHLVRGVAGESNIDGLLMGDHFGVAANLLDEVAEVDRLEVQTGRASALPGDKQEIVDEHRQMLCLLHDPLDRALIFGDTLVGAAQRNLAFAANDGEGSAQLVADIGEECAAGLVNLTQGLVRAAELLGALGHDQFEIGVGVLERLLVTLQVLSHAIEASAEIGELVMTGDGDTVGEVTLGELGGAAQELGKRRAQTPQQEDHEAQRGEDGERGVNLANPLESAQERRGVGIDPDDLGGFVGNGDLDQLVELLVDAALEQVDQLLPGDVGPAAAPELLDLGELVERVLELALDLVETLELDQFRLELVRRNDSELFLGEVPQRGKVRLDHLVEVGGTERFVGHAGEQGVGPGLEQLLTVPRKLELPLELLMGKTRARQVGVGLRHAPISERRRG